jgi:hypothetical protein
VAVWIVAHVPAWITGVVLIVVFPLAIVAIQAVLRRTVPALKKTEHNEVAGFLVAVIGVAYAVIAGFTIIVLWEHFTEAQNATKVEALRTTPLEQGSRVFGPATQARLRREVIAYNQSVVDNWDTIKQGTRAHRCGRTSMPCSPPSKIFDRPHTLSAPSSTRPRHAFSI